MKKLYITTFITSFVCIILFWIIYVTFLRTTETERVITVGFIYDGDESSPYNSNFIRVQSLIEMQFGEQVEVLDRKNVPEDRGAEAFRELIEEGCDLIFSTSYGYAYDAKDFAGKYPDIEFCQATADNANDDPVYENYHTFMGTIYEGRYATGVVAGMKLKELIETGMITKEEAKVGFVAAFPCAEVISGYTSFFMGVLSEVPEATMMVKYINSWSSYSLEKATAKELIEQGAVIIGQHTNTVGPAVACEEVSSDHLVYHVGIYQNMMDVAPTTSLIGTRINWIPYMTEAVDAVIKGEDIESHIDGTIHGNDVAGGLARDWVQMFDLNEMIAAPGTREELAQTISDLKRGKIHVFYGDYIGVDPSDPSDTYDLRNEYVENANSSAPTFHYVLKDVITVLE